MRKETTSPTVRLIGILAFMGSLISLPGCTTSPRAVDIKGEAEAVLNRDAGGNSLSVAVRLYQLKASDEFSKLTFDMLANGQPDADVIEADLLDRSEAILVPGGKFSNPVTIRDDAKYIGLIAFFRQPDPHYWRFLVEADKVRREGLSFIAKDCYLILRHPKPAAIPGQPVDAPPQCDRARAGGVAGTVPAMVKRQPAAAKSSASAASSKR
jgi:type VI secretion system protein VasD